jgi:hypothetical protein
LIEGVWRRVPTKCHSISDRLTPEADLLYRETDGSAGFSP